jgi:hypothetical protein
MTLWTKMATVRARAPPGRVGLDCVSLNDRSGHTHAVAAAEPGVGADG